MSQTKTRDRKAKKKRWKQRGGAGMVRTGGVARDPSSRVTGPLATIFGLTVVAVVVGLGALVIFNLVT